MGEETGLNGETVTTVSAAQLGEWLRDLNRHGDVLLAAIREGRVKATTTAGFTELCGQLREYSSAYLNSAFKVSELTAQKVTLVNAVFYLLKSCEGIAANADKIGELLDVLPIGEAIDPKAILTLLMDGKKRDTIINNVKIVAGAFDSSWLVKINLPDLADVLRDSGVDFTTYQNLAQALVQRLSTETKPENPNGEKGQ